MPEKQPERTGSKKKGSTGDRTKKWKGQASGKLQRVSSCKGGAGSFSLSFLWLEESIPQPPPPAR